MTTLPPPRRRTRRLRRLASAIRALDRAAPAPAVAERIGTLRAEFRLPAPEGSGPEEALARIGAGFARLPPEVPVALATLLLPLLRPATRTADR